MTALQQAVLGELCYRSTVRHTNFSLPFLSNSASTISCVLLDSKGRNIWEKTIKQPKNQTDISFQVPLLMEGVYNFWIEVEGKMHIRSIQIEEKQKRSVFGKLTSFLS